MTEVKTFTTADGAAMPVRIWQEDDVRAVVLVIHGMAEHGARYERFAGALGKLGFAVWAPDLRGHGGAIDDGVRGSFGIKDGWKRVMEDLVMVTSEIEARYPGKPLFLFGHSLGSLIGRVLLERHGERFRAAVLSGVFIDKPIRRNLSPFIASVLGRGRMEQPCQVLNDMTFKEYNKPFEGRTEFDWLSSIPGEVDRYVADPRCGFVCSAALYRDIGEMLMLSLRSRSIDGVPGDLPVLFAAGGMDPLGGGKAVDTLVSSWKKRGKKAEGKVYASSRHEVLNDVDGPAMTADIAAFFQKAYKSSSRGE